jgi:hypothetical protein
MDLTPIPDDEADRPSGRRGKGSGCGHQCHSVPLNFSVAPVRINALREIRSHYLAAC